LTQFFFGTNAYNVSKVLKYPLLIVPENLSFEKYKNILYPIIEEKISEKAIKELFNFLSFFEAKIIFLYITEEDKVDEIKSFEKITEIIEKIFEENEKPFIKKLIIENIDDAFDNLIFENKADLIVIEAHYRNILQKMFQKKPILSKLSSISEIPILVIQS
jgi:nucleotide-binding universal stress UspA family protein